MSVEPRGTQPEEPSPGTGLGYPTQELPTYHKVSGYPETTAEVSRPSSPLPAGSTGQLPVTGAPAPQPPALTAPRGPYLPAVLRGVLILVVAAFVAVWRLVDHPDWAVVGIGAAIGAGALFLVAALVSLGVQRSRREHEFDRMLSGS